MTYTENEMQLTEQKGEATQSLLVDGCLHCIAQCDQILSILSQEHYALDSKGSASIGAHIRHILDRFHCFFAGNAGSLIDYDARKRDREIEQNLDAATFALASVTRRIEEFRDSPSCHEPIFVKESVLSSRPAVNIPSTVERELMGLITHSIHHLAIIALLARSYGHQVDKDFGKAPSTIVYERA